MTSDRSNDPNFPVVDTTEVQPLTEFKLVLSAIVLLPRLRQRTLVEALSNELDIGEAEALA